uniref:Putative Fe3+-siderophore ABC transporter permease protein n=1 Tax=Magnetococcus massalia (strain MO-1) TaxID=451514 RepID=A0A1S7LPQ8_MAGMO|nr:Putative Fe3+-siderophore ABC transporter permease protein [Candidatus Magnetococcus massalia]
MFFRPFATLSLLLLGVTLWSLTSGSVEIPLATLWGLLSGDAISPMVHDILLTLRLPRIVAAAVVGGLLGLSGVILQVLLRNPLADPYVLGVSGGASVAALLVMALGGSMLTVPGAAMLGAILAMLLVFGFSRASDGLHSHRLLLTGVVLASGWGALINLILTIAPQGQLKGMLFWLMGDLERAESPLWPGIILLIAMLLTWRLGRLLNLLALGEARAASMGVAVGVLRTGLLILTSLLTALAVTTAGAVGFVGLVVPHMLRLLGMRDHRLLAPASALAGAALLIAADTIARTLFSPQQLPVGVVTAFIGVPLFLLILRRGRSG